MSKSIVSEIEPTPRQCDLTCRLRPRSLVKGPSPTAGEVELENTSSQTLALEVRASVLENLNLVVTNAADTVISDSFYGDLFSPLAQSYIVILKPGEKLTHPVSLLGNVSEKRRQPGAYTVIAVYQYSERKAVSEPVQVCLSADHASQSGSD